MDINSVHLTGVLVKGPRIRRTRTTGTCVINFTLASNGESFPCAMFGDRAAEMAAVLRADMRVMVDGRLQIRTLARPGGACEESVVVKANNIVVAS